MFSGGTVRWTDGLRLLPAVLAARVIPGGRPYKMLLSLTDRCNLRCHHCFTWKRTAGTEMSPDEAYRLLAGLQSLRWLDLTGGEPTLRPDRDAMADAVRDATVDRLAFLHFATNGFDPAASVAFADRLHRQGDPPLVVTVSLDGDPTTHDALRGRRGSFDRAVETARALDKRPGITVYVGTTVTPANADRLDATAVALTRVLPGLVPDRWHVNLMNRSQHFFGNAGASLPTAVQVRVALDQVDRIRGRSLDPFALLERAFLNGLRRHLRDSRPPVLCQALSASVFVSPTGIVHPCHVLDEPVGDLRDAGFDLDRVLSGDRARAARARVLRGCGQCWTPCEAYHALLGSPLAAVRLALEPSVRP